MQDTEEYKWIGYSNGVAYPLLKVGEDNTGLCLIEGGPTSPCWCTFERIEKIK